MRLKKEVETNIYRITQEALLNIIQHSRAKNAGIKISSKNKKLKLIAADDGIGFKFDKNRPKGIGLLNMIDRSKIIKADLKISSTVGKGTKIEITLSKKNHD